MGARDYLKGDHRVPLRQGELIKALEDKAVELDIPEQELMKRIGVGPTGLSILRGNVQQTIFSARLKKFADFLGVPMETFMKSRVVNKKPKAKTVVRHVHHYDNGKPAKAAGPLDGMELTLEYFRAIRLRPVVEQARAQRLLKFLMDEK